MNTPVGQHVAFVAPPKVPEQTITFKKDAPPTLVAAHGVSEFVFVWDEAVRLAALDLLVGFVVEKVKVGTTEHPNLQNCLQLRVEKNVQVVVSVRNIEGAPKPCTCAFWVENVPQLPDVKPVVHQPPAQPVEYNTNAPIGPAPGVVVTHGGGTQAQFVGSPGTFDSVVAAGGAVPSITSAEQAFANTATANVTVLPTILPSTTVVTAAQPRPMEAQPVSAFGVNPNSSHSAPVSPLASQLGIQVPQGKTVAEVATLEQAAEILARTAAMIPGFDEEDGESEWAPPTHSNINVSVAGPNGSQPGIVGGGTMVKNIAQPFLAGSGVLGSPGLGTNTGFGNMGMQGGVHGVAASAPASQAVPEGVSRGVFQASVSTAQPVGQPPTGVPEAQPWAPPGISVPKSEVRNGQTFTFLGKPATSVNIHGQPARELAPGEVLVQVGEVGVTLSRDAAIKIPWCLAGGILTASQQTSIVSSLERALQQTPALSPHILAPGMNEVTLSLTPYEVQRAIEAVKGNDQRTFLAMKEKFETAATSGA